MPQPRRRAGFAQKTKPRRFISEILFADDLQRHWALEIDVECLLSDPHRTATQLERLAVFVRHQFVMLKPLQRRYWCRLGRFLDRRLTGLYAASKTLAEHADRAEFHGSREFIAAAWAGALGLCFHGSNRSSEAIKTSQRAWIASSARSDAAWESGAWL